MIRVDKLNKYFNKGKSNEIHVINNTNLEFGDTGLVCILGESGSGKTTLLNTLGGLDNFHKGNITIDDITLSKHSVKEMEKIRNSKFGYVFQDKYLLQEDTVVYNIRLALGMFDISEEEKEERIDYVLRSVDMFKYKKRLISQLSGGQQQRIAIARALIKTPDIIFADEPTGNLDEANTMRIMSILKKISKDCLVILVTHEKQIADFFADRIIRVRDGKVIQDLEQKDQQVYKYSDDANIYLKEFEKESYHHNEVNLNIYNNGKRSRLELNLVSINDKYYIQTPDEAKVIFLNLSDEMQVVDDYKPSLDLEQIEEFDYALTRLEMKKQPKLSLKEVYKLAETNVRMLGKKKIFMIVSFVVTSILLVIASADYMTAASVDKKEVITENSNYINVEARRSSTAARNDYNDSFRMIYDIFTSDHVAEDIYISLNDKLSFSDDSYDQIMNLQYALSDFSYVTLEHFKEEDLFLGRMPKSRNEVIVDRWLLDKFYESDNILTTLIPEMEGFLGRELHTNNTTLVIVGICDMEEPTLFLDKYMGLSIAFPDHPVASLEQLQAAYPGVYDNVQLGLDEILVPESEKNVAKAGEENVKPFNGYLYKAAGTYPDDFNIDYVVGETSYNGLINNAICNDKSFVIYAEDKFNILNYFTQNLGGFDKTFVELKVSDTYQEELAAFEAERAVKLNARLIATLTIFAVSMFMLFFTMKSNAIKRVQEISVYRLMGISGHSIISAFVIEVVLITNKTVLPVVIIFSSAIKFIASIPSLQLSIIYPWSAMVVLLTFLYLVNIFVGILPVYSIVKLPPAQIAVKF